MLMIANKFKIIGGTKMEKQINIEDVKKFSATSFGITLSLFVLLKKILSSLTTNNLLLDISIEIIIAFSIFTLLFSIILNFFQYLHIRKKEGNLKIDETWYQVYIIEKLEITKGLTKGIRIGEVTIKLGKRRKVISAINRRYHDDSLSGHWEAENIAISDEIIEVDFKSTGKKGVNKGEMSLKIIGNPPNMMEGRFRDNTLYDTYGDMCWFKYKDDRDNHIKDYIKRMKEPEGSK